MIKHILQSFAITLIAAIGFTSCSREEKPCSEMTALYNTLEMQANELKGSLTPWGAKSDLNKMKIIWNNMMFHARTCKQCTKDAKKQFGSIDKMDAYMQQQFREVEKQLDEGSMEIIQNFIGGFLLGAGIL